MNAGLGVLRKSAELAKEEGQVQTRAALPTEAWDPARYADRQIQGLLHQVFFPGWPRPARQVVFSGASDGLRVPGLCVRIAQALAEEMDRKVCLVEADWRARLLEHELERTGTNGGGVLQTAATVPAASRQIRRNLWLVPAETFVGVERNGLSAAWMRSRLGDLRREFDYAVIHSPAIAGCGETTLLAHLADGLVLVLEAHRTRRLAAQKIRDGLQAANVRLLGAVLSERTFPVPEGLYRRL